MGIAAIIAGIVEMLKALFLFLATTEGQATVKSWRESSEAWNAAITKAFDRVENVLKQNSTWFDDLFKRAN